MAAETAKTFARDLTERAVKSFIQGALLVLAANLTVLQDNPLDLDNLQKVGLLVLGGGVMALLSFATSFLSKLKTGTASASVAVAEDSVNTGRHAAPDPGDS